MTVKLDLKPEVEAGLAAQAQARGLSLESYLDQVLRSAAIERASAVPPTQAEAIDRAKDLAARGKIHPHKRPRGRKSLSQMFAESPFKGLDLKFERDADTGRPVTL